MTRIVQIVPSIGPGTGVAGVAWNLEREFLALGVTVERFTFRDAFPRSGPLPRSRWRALIIRGWRVFRFSTAGAVLARRFLADRPDAISICHSNTMAGDVYVNHGVLLASMRARGNTTWRMLRNPFHLYTFLRDRARYRGRTHRVIVTLSANGADELRATYGHVLPPVVVIPNGVDLERFHVPRPEERRSARQLLNLGNDERVVMFLGHEFDRKGLRFAIEGLVVAESLLLLVVGGTADGISKFTALADRIGVGSRVLFVGPAPDPRQFLAASDLFVLPSAYEANALVVLEALATGLPVVTTPVGFAPEVVVDGENGFLAARDGRAFGERMAQLADLPDDELAEWRRRARTSVEAHGWRGVAERYLALAERLAGERDARATRASKRLRGASPAAENGG